jgi:hypothetical protein
VCRQCECKYEEGPASGVGVTLQALNAAWQEVQEGQCNLIRAASNALVEVSYDPVADQYYWPGQNFKGTQLGRLKLLAQVICMTASTGARAPLYLAKPVILGLLYGSEGVKSRLRAEDLAQLSPTHFEHILRARLRESSWRCAHQATKTADMQKAADKFASVMADFPPFSLLDDPTQMCLDPFCANQLYSEVLE